MESVLRSWPALDFTSHLFGIIKKTTILRKGIMAVAFPPKLQNFDLLLGCVRIGLIGEQF